MMTVALDRLFQDSLAIAMERNGMPGSVIGAIATCPPETRREISALLGELITADTPNDGIEIEQTDGTRMAPEQLRSAILSQRSSGVTQKITFLRIKDTMYETLVPLLSMVLAFGSHDMKAAVPALQSITLVWKNLVTLKRETDGTAIDVYEALVAARAGKRTAKDGEPTTQEIADRVPAKSLAEVAAALKRLADLKLIELVHSGGSDADISHTGNTWKVRL